MARSYSVLKRLVSDRLAKANGVLTDASFLENFNASLDELRTYVDFPEAKKTALLSPALFTDVTVYNPPSDLYTDSILAMRPFTEIPAERRNISIERNTVTEFDRNLRWNSWKGKFALEYNQGMKTLRLLGVMSSKAQNSMIHDCNTYDQNGTWIADTTGSDAANVQTNDLTFMEGSGSVSFEIDVSQSVNNFARIYNATMNLADESNLTSPYLFLYVYLPSVTDITSLTIVYGSDVSATPGTKTNYRTYTATAQFGGAAFVAGKNIIGLPRSGSVMTGTVDTDSIRYVEVTVTYSASQADMSGVLVDGIILRDGELAELQYYGANIIQTSGGTKQQYFVNVDDTSTLEPDTEILLVDWTAQRIAPNVKQMSGGQTLRSYALDEMERYKMRHPSERKKTKKNWYYH